MALVNQKYGRQGQADFVLYPLKAQFPAAFHDVTVGTISVPCNPATPNCIAVSSPIVVGSVSEGQIGSGTTPYYNAAAGYNLATGLGSVDAATLVADWGNVTFKTTSATLTPSSTSFTHGTAITVSGSVTRPRRLRDSSHSRPMFHCPDSRLRRPSTSAMARSRRAASASSPAAPTTSGASTAAMAPTRPALRQKRRSR